LRAGRGTPAAPARSGPSVLLLLSDPPRVPPYLSLDRRRLDAGGAIARQGLAIDLHSRPAALSAVSLSTPGRCDDAGHRPLGHGQGAGGACDRSPALIESELFGHRRGAFTGAVGDRTGWFEVCPPLGTVFLDEIGEVDSAIQVKLLRVLETRTFQRLGDTRERRFRGKVVAATNLDLDVEMSAGRFREDLYYRLCSDRIETPSLAERVHDSPREIADLVLVLAERQVGEELAPELAAEVVAWIDSRLGADYPWPGNVRELAQCVSNILIRSEYLPASRGSAADPRRAVAEEILKGGLSADEVLGRYCTLVYAETGSYQESARRLGLDRRTVKARV